MRTTAVVVDDDEMARVWLRELMAVAPVVDLVGEASDGRTGVRLIDTLRPDIAFLDIEMPGCSGIEVMRQVEHPPVVVFTTGHDEYAVTAFELAAADYLVKPIGPERFREALERAIRLVRAASSEAGAVGPTGDEAAFLPADDGEENLSVQAGQLLDSEDALTRLFLRKRDTILPVAVEEVLRFEADGDYVVVHTVEDQHLVRLRLQDLDERLGERFLRVHRSHLVNLDHVRKFDRQEDGRFIVVMDDGTRITASRTRSRDLLRRAR